MKATPILTASVIALMVGAVVVTKIRHPERPFFRSWAEVECKPSPTPEPSPVDVGTQAPVGAEIKTIPFEVKETWEARHARATPKYERCMKWAKKSKNPCATDRCADTFRDYVWPDQTRWGRTNEAICKEEVRERARRLDCVRKAIKAADEAERIVNLKDCGIG